MTNLDASTPQLKLAKKWIDAYSSLDISNLDPLLSKHYKHQTFPESTHPEETKEEHIKRYGGLASLITKLEFHVNEVIEAPGRVVLHNTSICSAHGTTYRSDVACILSLTEEDGELKVLQVKQFTDPQQQSTFASAHAAAKGAPAS